MLLAPQTFDIIAGISIMTIIIGFIFLGMRDGWTTTQVFSLALAVTTWFWASTALCRLLAPSMGIEST